MLPLTHVSFTPILFTRRPTLPLLYGIRERKRFIVLTARLGPARPPRFADEMDNLEGTVRFIFFTTST